MTRRIIFLFVIGLVLVGCSPEKTKDEKNTSLVSQDSSSKSWERNTVISTSTEQIVLQDPPEYIVKNKGELSIQDSERAYEMCLRALTDYYKAVWNGSVIELDTFIENEKLKLYTQKKIQYQYNLHAQSYDPVQNVEVVDWEVEFRGDLDGGYLYLLLPAHIKRNEGGFGEVTEFLVRNVNDKLVIADWYTGAKDSYDFMVRGENETIDDPDIWNNREWVEKLDNIQNEFSGSIR